MHSTLTWALLSLCGKATKASLDEIKNQNAI